MPSVKPTPEPRKPTFWSPMLWLAIFAVSAYVFTLTSHKPGEKVAYTQFKQDVRSGKVAKVNLSSEEASVTGIDKKVYQTGLPSITDPELMPLLEEHHVEVFAESERPSTTMTILLNLLPWILIFGFFYWSSRQMNRQLGGKGGMGGGGLFPNKGLERKFEASKTKVNYSDVAGCDQAKVDLQEVVEFMKEPERFNKIGASLPRGVLLMGPPGTGKTLLAKATANEAGVNFFSISGSEFIELYVGMGASRVRSLFERARSEAPSMIFIDEIDSIGRARGTGLGGGHDEREQTLNQILAEMDGFDTGEAVIVLAATNRPDVLDSALVRPGRFDRQITIDLPHKEAREKILAVHVRKVPLGPDVSLESISRATVGFSGAQLKNLVNEAALLAARAKRDQVNALDFSEARDKVLLGNPREEKFTEHDKKVTAIHEAGHALVAMMTKDADPVRKVTIIPRGRALGFTEQSSQEDRFNLTRSYIIGQIDILFGGRLAEELIYSEITTGAENDLKRATKLARKMVSHWGMSESFGPQAFDQGSDHPFLGKELTTSRDYSEHTAQLIDEEVSHILKEAMKRVRQTLLENRDLLVKMGEQLFDKELLSESDLEVYYQKVNA